MYRLREVVKRLKIAGFTGRLDKSTFLGKKSIILGYDDEVSVGGMSRYS